MQAMAAALESNKMRKKDELQARLQAKLARKVAAEEELQQKQVQAKEAETEMAIASMTLQFQGEQELMEVSAPF